jgi:hypothetical protein
MHWRPWATYLVSTLSSVAINLATSTVAVPARLRLMMWVVTATLVVVGLADIAVRRHARTATSVLAHAADDLAEWARQRAASMLLQARNPIEIPVRYDAAPAGWMDQWSNICRTPAGEDGGPVDLAGRRDRDAEFTANFDAVFNCRRHRNPPHPAAGAEGQRTCRALGRIRQT